MEINCIVARDVRSIQLLSSQVVCTKQQHHLTIFDHIYVVYMFHTLVLMTLLPYLAIPIHSHLEMTLELQVINDLACSQPPSPASLPARQQDSLPARPLKRSDSFFFTQDISIIFYPKIKFRYCSSIPNILDII